MSACAPTAARKRTSGNVVGMDTGAIYNALRRQSEFDVGVVFATDGRISAFDLAILRDDRRFFPSYLLTPVVRDATLRRHPTLRTVLESLSARLDNETMISLNAAIDRAGERWRTLRTSSCEAARYCRSSRTTICRLTQFSCSALRPVQELPCLSDLRACDHLRCACARRRPLLRAYIC
jgi:hypothetical protein